MTGRFTRALVRAPGASFADGLTTSTEGRPVLAAALEQHRQYAAALGACGLALRNLPADERFPDGTFVEDTAVVTPKGAVLTRPGAPSRLAETESVAPVLGEFYPALARITAPGTVDGGDVCESDLGFLIGISARTSPAGARELADLLADLGYGATLIDIRGVPGLLHLKTWISYLGDGRLAVAAQLPSFEALARYERVVLVPEESYAANCIRVNERVLIAAGYPRFAEELARLGYDPLPLPMSEFRKMDGGLSCLSLRF